MNEKYIPLYRKYRPQRLEEIVGQNNIKKALANAIEMNHISHAYLFTGPRGTGKTSTARIFAKSLNCENGPTVNPCGECTNCVEITNSVPMDVIEIDAASNRKVEDAQNILERVMYAPVKSKYKIYIIDEVHMLSNTAFNALLKTLEEPPKNVVFILATTEVHKVPDTIKSRCQRFDFRRISTSDIVNHLRFISNSENINITDDALMTIAANSAGGMRDSIALLDQLSVLNSEKAISTEDINNLLGRLSFDILHKLADGIISSKPEIAIDVLENIYNAGNEPSLILSSILEYFKNMLIIKNCNSKIAFELTQLNDVQFNTISKQITNLETIQITNIIDLCAKYIQRLKTTTNQRLWMEVCVIDLANLTENTSLKEIQNRLLRLEGGSSTVTPKVYFNKMTAHDISQNIKKLTEKPLVKQIIPSDKLSTNVSPDDTVIDEANNDKTVTDNNVNDEFSPMPKAKPKDENDISITWAKLLSEIQSVPTVTLLKQWANPIKISPEETIISIKTELFLNRISSGNKKEMIVDAVNKLFNQQNSTVIIRLPLPDDISVKADKVISSQKIQSPDVANQTRTQEEDEFAEEIINTQSDKTIPTATVKKATLDGYSDQVNMVVDLFDGKVIE